MHSGVYTIVSIWQYITALSYMHILIKSQLMKYIVKHSTWHNFIAALSWRNKCSSSSACRNYKQNEFSDAVYND